MQQRESVEVKYDTLSALTVTDGETPSSPGNAKNIPHHSLSALVSWGAHGAKKRGGAVGRETRSAAKLTS